MIDKLGLSTINWKVDGKNRASDEFEEGTEQYYQNRLIRDFLTLLIDPNTANILHRSIDNDTKLLTDIVDELEGKTTSIEEPYGFYSLATQTERKNDYITGKIGIGPFALNNNNHILTMLYGVRFKNIPGSIMSELGLTNLATPEDFEHNSVMSWISALINAHVDIAKDPYISKLNVNPYTYNLVNTLIRTGFGRNTFYFTTQPIMKELAQAYMNAASMYMANKNKTQYQLLKEAVEEVADAHFTDMDLFGMKYEDWKKVFDPKDTTILNASTRRADFNAAFKQLVDNGVLESNANKEWLSTHGAVVEYNNKPVNLTNDQVQMMMYFANLQFDPYAKSVSSLVKYAKIDTKKHGKSYVEQHLYEQGFDELFFDSEGTGLFESYGIHRMVQESYIKTKTRNAIAMTKNILKGQFLQSTKAFDRATAYILDQIGRKGSKDVDLNNKVARIIMAAIKSEFINEYASKIRKDNPTYIRDLVSESEETFEYTQAPGDKAIVLQSASKYDLESYINGRAYVTFKAPKGAMKIGQRFDGGTFVVNVQEGEAESTYTLSTVITGANTDARTITTPITRKSDGSGTVRITKGKNTIYDRFDRMLMQIKNDPSYKDVLDEAGEPINMLLRSLVHGRTFDYQAPTNNFLGEMPDTYANLKFLKLFNALDQNGIESNYIIDGWDELLHDNKHPLLKEFAEDLVVYAFVTSGDQGGFTKMFKQVPFSWRKESGYGDFIREKIQEFDSQEISAAVLEDAILNNWFDNDIVRTYYSTRTSKDGKRQIPQFITYSGESKSSPVAQYNPLILAALMIDEETQQYTPSIDSKNAPRFIKVPRRNYKAAKDSQRAYTVYEKIDDGMKQTADGKWITFPIYVKVEPKGNQLKGNYLMTEYGRDDSRAKERTPNREALSKAYKLGDFISRQTVKEMSDAWGDGYAQIVESLNYNDMLRKFQGDMRKFKKAYETSRGALYNLIGKEVVVYTKDNYGFHNDELTFVVKQIKPTNNGYLLLLQDGGVQYNVHINLDYEVSNKDSKFYEILVPFEGEDISLKDYIENTIINPEEVESKLNDSKNINNISDKTEAFGVEISKNSEEFWLKIRSGWQQSHPTGIVAYRKYGDKPETFSAATVNQGWIGNPFSTTSKGEDTVLKFYDWIVSGETFGNPRALEEFRQAIIQKILATPNDTDVLYYTELGRPSHATVIGYLIKNKDLLKPQKEENSELTEEEQREAEKYKKMCEGE